MKRSTILAVAALSVGVIAFPARAQRTTTPEIRPFVGVNLPVGAQRDLFKDEGLFGAQAALELTPNLHVLGTFGWVPGRTRYAVDDDGVNIYLYDVGAEFNLIQPTVNGWLFRPFVGIGAGARTYAYSDVALKDRTCAAGYGALGMEFQFDRLAFRAEGRDNVFCYKAPFEGVKSKTRTDLGLALGLAFHFR